MSRIETLVLRLLRAVVPSQYRGRLDRYDIETQQAIMGNNFRSGM